MSSLFSPPSPASVPPPAPVPTPADPEIQRKREAERLAQLRRRGLNAAILTGGLGDTRPAPVQRPSLLGQVGARQG